LWDIAEAARYGHEQHVSQFIVTGHTDTLTLYYSTRSNTWQGERITRLSRL
jgi:hypothetical protein